MGKNSFDMEATMTKDIGDADAHLDMNVKHASQQKLWTAYRWWTYNMESMITASWKRKSKQNQNQIEIFRNHYYESCSQIIPNLNTILLYQTINKTHFIKIFWISVNVLKVFPVICFVQNFHYFLFSKSNSN